MINRNITITLPKYDVTCYTIHNFEKWVSNVIRIFITSFILHYRFIQTWTNKLTNVDYWLTGPVGNNSQYQEIVANLEIVDTLWCNQFFDQNTTYIFQIACVLFCIDGVTNAVVINPNANSFAHQDAVMEWTVLMLMLKIGA